MWEVDKHIPSLPSVELDASVHRVNGSNEKNEAKTKGLIREERRKRSL